MGLIRGLIPDLANFSTFITWGPHSTLSCSCCGYCPKQYYSAIS